MFWALLVLGINSANKSAVHQHRNRGRLFLEVECGLITSNLVLSGTMTR